MKQLMLDAECTDALEPRIGGGALIGGIASWPTTSAGEPLQLVASLPIDFVCTDTENGIFISIFSFYSSNEYFLDRVTYHGDPSELNFIQKNNNTCVIFHKRGDQVFGDTTIPARKIVVGDEVSSPFQGSGIGSPAGLLQNEDLVMENDLTFSLQLYAGDFPDGWTDIFGLSDALGYLYINPKMREGLFFVQTT